MISCKDLRLKIDDSKFGRVIAPFVGLICSDFKFFFEIEFLEFEIANIVTFRRFG